MKNYGSFKSFGFIYIYIYIDRFVIFNIKKFGDTKIHPKFCVSVGPSEVS